MFEGGPGLEPGAFQLVRLDALPDELTTQELQAPPEESGAGGWMRASISLTGALILSYPRVTAVKRQVRKSSTDTAAQRGARADGHQLSEVGRVGLADLDVGDAGGAELRGDATELRLVGRGEHDGEGARLKISRARLARRVGDLGGGNASGQVRPHDEVVGQDIRPGVNWRATLPDDMHRRHRRQAEISETIVAGRPPLEDGHATY